MRGSPAIHLFIVLVGFALFAVPLAKLTFARPEIEQAHAEKHAAASQGKVHCVVTIRFVQKPESLSLKIAGREEIATLGKDSASPLETTVEVDSEPTLLEILAKVTWPNGTPEQALTVDVEPDGRDALSQTRWSADGRIDAVFSYHWSP